MARKTEERPEPPTESFIRREGPDSLGSTQETHPSYGVVQMTRRSGRHHLFMSGVQHQNYVAIVISEAARVERGQEDHAMALRQVCEINMTESQFAQMLFMANMKEGSPCTIRRVQGDQDYGCQWGRPDAPRPEKPAERARQQAAEYTKIADEADAQAEQLVDDMESGKLKPTKANLRLLQELQKKAKGFRTSNQDHVVNVYAERIEEITATAIMEFEGHKALSLANLGISVVQADNRALQDASSPLELAAPKEE